MASRSQTELLPKLKESLANSKCEYRYLGKSGLRVSVPIFGCMSFGDPRTLNWAVGEDEARTRARPHGCLSNIRNRLFPS